MNIGPSSTPTVVFTAVFPGVYSFVITGSTLLGSQVFVNGAAVSNEQNVSSETAIVQKAFSVYMAHDDALSYQGPVAELFGVRLGNEF
jgi:hypothetical protein